MKECKLFRELKRYINRGHAQKGANHKLRKRLAPGACVSQKWELVSEWERVQAEIPAEHVKFTCLERLRM